ncbi:MAG: T9SS type A sorting domain-containing protein [Saprospiraceae bacterium]|nr:T9SS type A sorting domain-containing protein [Saprospiraceae bacterium]
MTKSFTFRGILSMVLLAACFQAATAQAFWTETFSDQGTALTNWEHGGTNGGTINWDWTDVLAAGNWQPGDFMAPTASTGYMWFDSDANGEFAHDVTLTGTGNPADCSGKSNVHLKFYTYFRTFTGSDIGTIGISTDGVNFTYHNVPQFDALEAEVSTIQLFQGYIDMAIPEADGQATVWVQFRWQGEFEYYWKVDDLEMYEAAGAVPCDMNPDMIICDNIESYNLGNISPQAAHWSPWSGAQDSQISAEVSDEQASDGTKSMKVKKDGASGDDQLLLLGNKNTGRYSLKWMMYVGAGNAAYFNIQNSETAGQQFNGEFYLYTNGEGEAIEVVNNQQVVVGSFNYPQEEWFPVEMIFDLDNDLAKVYVAGELARGWAYPGDVGGIDFYAADNSFTFYVDQVEYVGLPAVTYNEDECSAALDITQYFGGTPNVPQTTGLFDNTTATVGADDPVPGCFLDDPTSSTDGSLWFTFTGDGGKYHVETVPCSAGANYIDNGDTQMALYTGDCGSFVSIECNDDLDPDGFGDFRAGFDITTESGIDYHLLVDGWSDANGVSMGQFCIEVTRLPDIDCAQGAVGTYTLDNNSFVCFGSDVFDILTLNQGSYTIPNSGALNGASWAVTTVPVSAGVWPPSLGAQYLGSTPVSPVPFSVSLPNDDPALTQPVILYFTPVVVGNASSGVSSPGLGDVDTTGACFFIGVSSPVIYLPALQPLVGTATFTQVVDPPGSNGAIDLTVTGGFYEFLQDPSAYTVTWTGPNNYTSNDEDPTGLEAGTYVASVSDITGCVSDISVTVSVTTPTKDPVSVKTLQLSPNPSTGIVLLNLELATAADVRVDVLNTLGQALQSTNAGKVNNYSQLLDLSRFAEGTYFLRVTVDGETAIRRVVIQR